MMDERDFYLKKKSLLHVSAYFFGIKGESKAKQQILKQLNMKCFK